MLANSILAEPIANLIRAAHLVDSCGVCGMYASSTFSIPGSNIKTHQLLAHIVTVPIARLKKPLAMHTIDLRPGAVSLKDIFDRMSGVEVNPRSDFDKKIFQVTEMVQFRLITGQSKINEPLSEDRVQDYVQNHKIEGYKLITTPLPFGTKTPIAFTVKPLGDGTSEITFNGISDSEAELIMTEIAAQYL